MLYMVQKGVETVPPSTWECSRRLQPQLQLASTIQRGKLLG
jgi:hypothetical protein